MTARSMFTYDDPNCTVRREFPYEIPAAASGTYALHAMRQKFRLKGISGVRQVAGTSAYTLVVRNGTTALGTITVDTLAALTTFTADITGTVASLEMLNCLKSNEATGRCVVSYELEVLPDAQQTV
jgi:cellulase/cellobiase CelA1